jgi:hypothetical protein
MQRIWEIITIMYLRAHPKEKLPPIRTDDEAVMDMDQSRAEGIRAQKRMRERIKKQQESKKSN